MALRVLHLSTSDDGGAGRACVRLHTALLQNEVDSILLVQNKTSDCVQTLRLAKSKFQKIIEKLRPALASLPLMLYPKRHKDIFSPTFIYQTIHINFLSCELKIFYINTHILIFSYKRLSQCA